MELSPGWQLDLETRGPWLLAVVVNARPGLDDTPPLADYVWRAMQERGLQRLVIDLGGVALLHSHLLGQLIMLFKRVSVTGGVLRLCGLSPGHHDVLRTCRLDDHFVSYATREEALAAG